MARQSYLKNAAILTGTGLLLRAAGMFFRIYIAARIGAEGMGLSISSRCRLVVPEVLANAAKEVDETDEFTRALRARQARAMGE